MKDHLHQYVRISALRSDGEALLVVLPAEQVRLASTQRRAFSVVASQLWNSLSLEACLAPSLIAFQKSIQMELFQRAFL